MPDFMRTGSVAMDWSENAAIRGVMSAVLKTLDDQVAFIGRQPIFDRDLKVTAYELLFRDSQANRAVFDDADGASAKTLAHAVTEFGLPTLVGDHRAFVNATRNIILGLDSSFPLKAKFVFEILEDVTLDTELIDAVRRLSKCGFTFALDDFRIHDGALPILPHIGFIKLDVLMLSQVELAEHVNTLRLSGTVLIAEKVETHDQLELCRKLGFDLFQGYFFCRPDVLHRKEVSADKLTLLGILANISSPSASARTIEELVGRDVGFTHKLLKLINSAAYNLPSRIDSIRTAVVVAGMKQVRALASLLLLASLGGDRRETTRIALVRAKMAESIAEALGYHDEGQYFTAGLLSVLDAILDQPMDEILHGLPLDKEIANALLHRKGRVGEVLSLVVAYERGEAIPRRQPGLLTAASLRQASLSAVQYCNEEEI